MNEMAEDKVNDAVDVEPRSLKGTSVPATGGDGEDLIVALQDRVDEDTSLPYLLDLVDLAYGAASTAQLCVLYAGSRLLVWARSQDHTDEFAEFRKLNGIGGEAVEGQVADIILRRDPEYDDKKPNTIRSRRSYYANAMGWFADLDLCTFSGSQMLADARAKGSIKGIAALYAKKQKTITENARKHARTTAATAKREENRRKVDEARRAEEAAQAEANARIAREHAEAEERRRQEKIDAAKAALVEDVPLAPPPVTVEPEPTADATAGDTHDNPAPEFLSRDEGEPTNKGEPTADADTEHAEADAEDAGQPQPAPLADILDYLGNVRRDDRGWRLAEVASVMIHGDGIYPDPDLKVRAPISVIVQIVDGTPGDKPTRHTIVDFDLCIQAVVKLIEERRLVAELTAQKHAAD